MITAGIYVVMQVSLLHCQYCQKLSRQGRSILHKLFLFKVQGQLFFVKYCQFNIEHTYRMVS